MPHSNLGPVHELTTRGRLLLTNALDLHLVRTTTYYHFSSAGQSQWSQELEALPCRHGRMSDRSKIAPARHINGLGMQRLSGGCPGSLQVCDDCKANCIQSIRH